MLCSVRHLRRLPRPVQARAVRIRSSVLVGGVYHCRHQDDRSSALAAQRAYAMAGVRPSDIDVAVNPSGGLVARGHPIGATGIIMLNELALQLRGAAGDCQVPGAALALQENGGGVIGLDIAVCSVMVLERNGS